MRTGRSAGILLHPTSLPGPYDAGELGPEAFRFVKFLEKAGQKLWQVLPLNPTDIGGSPYSSCSAFAGNPLLVSTERLVQDGLLAPCAPASTNGPVDYRAAIPAKTEKLRRAFGRAKPGRDLKEFCEEHRGWLEDYALFMALKDAYDGAPWTRWDTELSSREPGALGRARRNLEHELLFHKFVQHLLFRHWQDVKAAANGAGISIVGDLPIFVSHDSADVWANQELFFLGESGEPTVVAGVPPDYFSETGQLWGNPLYDWSRMREDGYSWWVERLRTALTLCDAVRLDHFRGFETYWEVPAGEETAVNGRWVEGPGTALFGALRSALGELPLVAEDLGEITPEVARLREKLGLPGMKVLQFAFSGPGNPFLPHGYKGDNWVVYTGTHDNDTTAGWWVSASREEREFARRYLGKGYAGVWDFVRLAYSSTARWAIVPMQDALGLGSEARMNTPGTTGGNWSWRMDGGAMSSKLAGRLREFAELYGR